MGRSLRVGVNALFLIPGGVGGTEIYLRHLISAIARSPRDHEYVVFTNHETTDLVPAHPQFREMPTGVHAKSRPSRILYEQFLLPFKARAQQIDVLFNAGQTAPLPLAAPNCTYIFDLQHRIHPEFFKPADLLATRVLLTAAQSWSREITTISEASRQDIHRVYGIPLNRITAGVPGVDPDIVNLPRASADEPFILYVSTLHPHKNHEMLLDAFAEFRKLHPEYRMVFAGMHGFHHEAVKRRIEHQKLEDAVTITGWISREGILDLYTRARIAVFPSRFEGFGIPILEAMTVGVPLIASNIPPMSEAAGDAALLADPYSAGEWASALDRFASSPALREDYAARGRKRAAQFSWDHTASLILDSIERTAR